MVHYLLIGESRLHAHIFLYLLAHFVGCLHQDVDVPRFADHHPSRSSRCDTALVEFDIIGADYRPCVECDEK